MICYKVVEKNLKSAVVYSSGLQVQYKIGEFVEANFASGLLVFRRKKYAVNWMSSEQRLFICECEKRMKLPEYCICFWLYNIYSPAIIVSVWDNVPLKYKSIVAPWPINTLAFKKVKLLKEIKV